MLNGCEHRKSSKKIENEIQDKRRIHNNKLPIKEFSARNSILTDLIEDKHIKTAFNIFIAISLSMAINSIFHDYFYNGQCQLGLRLLFKQFASLHKFALIWSGMFLSSLLVYTGFNNWAVNGRRFAMGAINLKLLNYLWLTVFALYCLLLLTLTTWIQLKLDLSLLLKGAVSVELMRFLMKIYAYVRSNVPKILNCKKRDEVMAVLPKFSHYLYFLFAPTLVYRDSYPRSTTKIRWNYVIRCFIEIIVLSFCVSITMERSFLLILKDYGLRRYTWQEITMNVLQNCGHAMLISMATIYLIFHAVQNAFAEIFGFSDRLFYKDWWLSSDYERYYRTWNNVIYDWLYTYIYKDFYEYVTPNNKIAAKFMVFFISAIFHEFVLIFGFKFVLPLLFFEFFGFSLFFSFLKSKSHTLGNIFVLYTAALGMSVNFNLYTMEYFARQRCPVENETFWNYFIPRFIDCNQSQF